MGTGPSYGGIPRLRGIEWNRRNTYAHTTCPGDNRQIWFIRFPSFPFHASLPPFFSPSSNFKPKRFSLARFFDDDEGDGEGELFVRFQLKLCHFFRMINYVLSLDGFERLKCKGSLLLTIHMAAPYTYASRRWRRLPRAHVSPIYPFMIAFRFCDWNVSCSFVYISVMCSRVQLAATMERQAFAKFDQILIRI